MLPRTALARVLKSSSIRGALTFGIGGIGFAVANLLLAARLPAQEFGLVSLFLALLQFGLSAGPLGLDVVVKRHGPAVDRRLVLRAVLGAAGVAILIASAAAWVYGFELGFVLVLFVGLVGTACNNIAVGIFQGSGVEGWAMVLAQSPNWYLLALALLAPLAGMQSATALVVAIAAGYCVTSFTGWRRAAGSLGDNRKPLDNSLIWREGLSAVSIGIALQVLWQFERIVIPRLTTMGDLATYAVLAALVGAPFRVTQLGVSFTLLPRLRNADGVHQASAVLRREMLTAAVLVGTTAVALFALAPFVFHVLLKDKYPIGAGLVAATLSVGVVRVAESFSTSVVTALGSSQALRQMSFLGWGGLLVAAAAAIPGGLHFGLLGVILGTCCGWLFLVIGGTLLARRSFKTRFGMAVA